MKKIGILLFLITTFFLAVAVWYSPIIFKGYPIQTIPQDVLLARNYSKVGILATQDKQSIVISSGLIKERGFPLEKSEYLRSVLYAKIFDFIGIPKYEDLVLLSIILYAIALIFFTISILYLFNLKTAVIFALIYIFSPLGWGLTHNLGFFEFFLLFLGLFFIFYTLGIKKSDQGKNTIANFSFVISGICLFLSALSKEAALVFALSLFIFLLIKKNKQQLIYIFVPFILLLLIFWLPSVLRGTNIYIPSIIGKQSQELISIAPLHIFPDPYTYYFEKEQFLEQFKNQKPDWSENLQTVKDLTNTGLGRVGFFRRIGVGFYILIQHLFRFFSLEDFGGPFISALFILGIISLKYKRKFLYQLSFYWLTISLFVFSFILLVGRNHLMDFIWLILLLITLGLFYLFEIFQSYLKLSNKKQLIFAIVAVGLIIYNFILANHVLLGREYDRDAVPKTISYVNEIKKLSVQNFDVIAVPGDFPTQMDTLNYLTDKSFLLFHPATLERLVNEGKLKKAFEAFGVKYILGYPDELSNKMVEQTKVINIASSSLKINMEQVSNDKSFLMNLIR